MMEKITAEGRHEHTDITIAIADDHVLLRDLLVDSINSLPGCKIVVAGSNGAELIEGIEKLNEPPLVCILDINMPVMNGYETQLAVKKRWPKIKSLALSIYDELDCIIEMLKNGADGFVTKSSPKHVFHEALLTVCSGDSYYKQLPASALKNTKPLPHLTDREKEYVTLLCSGLHMEKIALKLNISIRTLEHYRDSVYQKLGVNNQPDLIFYVLRTGIVYIKQ